MDNLGVTTFAPAFIKNNNLIKLNNTRYGNNVDATNKYIKLHRTGVIKSKSNLRFKEPFVIRFNNIPETKKVYYRTDVVLCTNNYSFAIVHRAYSTKINYSVLKNIYKI
jgi:hypothetical protein